MDLVVRVGEGDGVRFSAGRRETPLDVHWCPGQVPGGVGWMPVCPHPCKLGMSMDVQHNGTNGTEGERTRKATLLPIGYPNLTFRRKETECPLGRCELGLGEALCRAAFKLQYCQGQTPKPLPRVPAYRQLTGLETAHSRRSAGQADGLLWNRDRAHPRSPITAPQGLEQSLAYLLRSASSLYKTGRLLSANHGSGAK